MAGSGNMQRSRRWCRHLMNARGGIQRGWLYGKASRQQSGLLILVGGLNDRGCRLLCRSQLDHG